MTPPAMIVMTIADAQNKLTSSLLGVAIPSIHLARRLDDLAVTPLLFSPAQKLEEQARLLRLTERRRLLALTGLTEVRR
jgi:hypothetical protein